MADGGPGARRVLLTGGSGQLGTELRAVFADAELLAPSRSDLDVTDAEAVLRAVRAFAPHVVVNAAAMNDVDGAEERPLAALEANALAVRALARAADEADAVLVHFGSDFVFDGLASAPYREEDAPRPRSIYGVSKLLGEDAARSSRGALVFRVESLFGGARRKSTVDRLAAALGRGEPVRAFTDRVVSPSYVPDVAAAVRAALDRGIPPGLYHCVNGGHATWRELAEEAARLLGRPGLVTGISTAEVALRAERPRWCALSNAKLAAAGVAMPGWQNALARALAPDSRSARVVPG